MASARRHTYIYQAQRTPIGAFNGAFAGASATDLAAQVIRAVIARAGLAPQELAEVVLGNAVAAGLGQAPARQAARKAGLPDDIPAVTVNKVCGSGLQALIMADRAIRLGEASFIVTGGMENMTQAPYLAPHLRSGHKLGHHRLIDSLLHDGLTDPLLNNHMGELCEALAKQYKIGRAEQDEYAFTSYARARQAQNNGLFKDEIVPIEVKKGRHTVKVDTDEQPQADDIQQLPQLSPVFDRQHGAITKGNGAKINDGAAIILAGGKTRHLRPLARVIGHATHAQEPATFALAPVGAIRKLAQACDLDLRAVDLFEINEAFAAMSLIVNQELGLAAERVNVHGGAIALGHPIGATGARILVTLLHALRQRGLKRGIAALCIGGGEAIAVAIETV